jgi:hypothetical protein
MQYGAAIPTCKVGSRLFNLGGAQLEKSQWHIETNQVSAKGQLLIEWKSIFARAAEALKCEMIDGDGALTEI